MDFNDIINKFTVKINNNNSVMAVCPCHSDRKASLSINYDEKTNKTLLFCHAGCDTKSVLDAVGLTFGDLGSNVNRSNEPGIENIYPYVDEQGNLLFEKIRYKDKNFSQRRYVNGHIIWGLSAGVYTETFPGSNNYSPKDRPGAKSITLQEQNKVLYNLPRLIDAITKGYPVYIVEGEKDVNTMAKLGLVATTAPSGAGKGGKKWLDSYSEYFKSASVIIMPDNDEPGQDYAKKIQSSLRNYAHATKIITISDKPKGDITDWINEGHDIRELKEIIDKASWDYAPWIYERNSKGALGVNQGIIAACLRRNLKYKLIGSPGSNKTMIFTYSNGIYKEISKKSLNKYVEEYIPSYLVSNNLLNSVTDLLTNEDVYPYSILNGSENIINLQNGLYDVTTGELKPHSSDYISSIQLNVKYNPNYINHGYWDNFLDTLTMGDNELKNIIQEWYGLILSNYDASEPKKLLLLHGVGDTGKSKLITVLEKLLGKDNSKSIAIQKLGDRFALGDIFKTRLVHYGDLPSKTIEDSSLSILKIITGGDTLSVEKKGIDPFDIEYRGALMYSCNELPVITGDLGNHVFNRFMIIPCNNPIPKDKQDPKLLDKLLLDKEYIFTWSMEGLKRLMNNNLKFSHSEKSEDAKEGYSIKSDSVRAFIYEKYDITGDKKDKVAPILYDEYVSYCNIEGRNPVNKANFKERMKNIGVEYRKNSNFYYFGLKKKELTPIEEDSTPFEEIPLHKEEQTKITPITWNTARA